MPTNRTKQLARALVDALDGVSAAEARLERAQQELKEARNVLETDTIAFEKEGEDGTYVSGEYIITRSTATYTTEPTRRSTVQIQRAVDVSRPEF